MLNKKTVGAAIIIIVVALIFYFSETDKNIVTDKQPSEQTSSVNGKQKSSDLNPKSTLQNKTSTSVTITAYKNGDYSTTENYDAPDGNQSIKVKTSLKDDIIADASIEPQATEKASKTIQENFAEKFKQYVVGKNIYELTLDKVAGASLTTNAFNQALKNIRSQAQ